MMKSSKHSEAKSSDAIFKRLLGVKPEIFERMASILRKEYVKMHKLGGSPPKLPVEAKLTMALKYLFYSPFCKYTKFRKSQGQRLSHFPANKDSSHFGCA